MNRARHSRNRQAFTLVEVLATLVLVAAILPVAMKAVTLATEASGLARREMEAVSLAETKLTELVSLGEWTSLEPSGDFGSDYPAYRWQAELEDVDGSTLKQLTVRVLWTVGTRTRNVELTTLIYDSGQAE